MGDVQRRSASAFRPGAFRVEHIGVGGRDAVDAMVRVLDKQDIEPAIYELRDWGLNGVTPRTGETAIDIGSGTGVVTRRLADAVGPTGSAIGVEPNPDLRAIAVARGEQVTTTATYVDGSADALPFDDESIDVVWCERVFQHLADPVAAAHEIARVLRPGGRAVVIDADHGSRINSVGDPDVVRRVDEVSFAHAANPFAARHIPRQLSHAGLDVQGGIGSRAVIMPVDWLIESGIHESFARQAVADGAVSQEEADALIADLHEAASVGEAFVSVTTFGFIARR